MDWKKKLSDSRQKWKIKNQNWMNFMLFTARFTNMTMVLEKLIVGVKFVMYADRQLIVEMNSFQVTLILATVQIAGKVYAMTAALKMMTEIGWDVLLVIVCQMVTTILMATLTLSESINLVF